MDFVINWTKSFFESSTKMIIGAIIFVLIGFFSIKKIKSSSSEVWIILSIISFLIVLIIGIKLLA